MFTFKTYQKPISLYQYITPYSAHPPGVIRGVVYSQLLQYFKQNSQREDYWKIAISFYRKFKARGWSKTLLGHIFNSVHEEIMSRPRHNYEQKTKDEPQSLRDQLILHIEYHPNNFP